MKVLILEDRGIYKKGKEVEMARPKGQQWIDSGYAESDKIVIPAFIDTYNTLFFVLQLLAYLTISDRY